MFLRLRDPGIEFALRPLAGPELVLVAGGRIDHAGDMPGAGHDMAHRTAEQLAAAIDGDGGRDVVFLARLDIGRGLDDPEIDRRVVDAQRIGFDQLVVAIKVGQILLMPLAVGPPQE